MKQTIKEEIIKNNVFSSNETVIGTFVDGKPIYRKVYITQTADNMNLYLNHNLTNLDRFWLDTDHETLKVVRYDEIVRNKVGLK